ncbi:UNVERIFIED_CONTAM: hypothetical protein FKN15_024722 [Acipenser sinensis]
MRKNIIYPDCDIKFTGHVSWVGKTSMEAKMHMLQYHDGAYSPVLDATFVMVARDPENKRAAFVNPLIPEGPEEEALFKQGEVLICYSHTKDPSLQRSPLSIVTALVDKIDMRKNIIYPDCDIKFTGHVSWVGKTSMEAKMHMLQYHDGAYSPVLDATFVMVARDPENKRAAFVNPLIPEGPEEEALFKQGEVNKTRRSEIKTASLLKMAPTAEERKIVHSMFLNTLDSTGSRPHLVAVDDIMFQKPVEIGSLLFLSSQVCYTKTNHIQVRVHTEVFDSQSGKHNTTNIFHFTFCSEKEVPQIVPKSYGESMLYLDGKRHFDITFNGTPAV